MSIPSPTKNINSPELKTRFFTAALVMIMVGWVVYKYRAMLSPFYQPIIDRLWLSMHLTPAGEIATIQAPANMITLDSVAKSLGIATSSELPSSL